MLRVALVGKRSGHFTAGLRSVGEVTIAGLCELDPAAMAQLAELAQAPDARRFTDYAALLDQLQPDVVVLGTPMPLHVPQAVQALDRAIHVLSEVPAAVDLAQCRQLLAAVQRSSASYMLAENYLYLRHTSLVRAMAQAGCFGDCYYAEGAYLHELRHLHHLPDGRPTWRAEWQVGKRGCTYGTHSLGPALEFFGPAARVAAVTCLGSGSHTDPEHPHDDSTVMLCQLASGGLISIRLDMLSNRPHNMTYYALQGTRGCYEAPRGFGDDHKVWLNQAGGDPAAPDPLAQREWHSLWEHAPNYLPAEWRTLSEAARRTGHNGGDYLIARAFIQAVQTGAPPPVDVYRALDYTLPGLLSEQSIAVGGQPVLVPDPRRGLTAPAPAAPTR